MEKFKATSKEEIKQKVKELEGLKIGLEFLLKSHATLAGTLKLTFSESCIECGKTDQFIKNTRDIFISNITKVVGLYNSISSLLGEIVPNRYYPHLEDYNDDGSKPVLDETYNPLI